MSRSRLPPTPSMSGELIVKEQSFAEGSDSSFQLPPAALSPSKIQSPRRNSTKSERQSVCFPASPTSPNLIALGRNTTNPPPRQTGTKRPLEDLDLPPPPTRTRKIIQMKPKTQTTAKPAAGASRTSSNNDSTTTGKTSSNGAGTTNSKKKQPSATSAAGRKIARKTAHSLIERRRRSKMNEEFATLKDMIPACRGQEMHKLAILQASIDYVNYLEQCIKDLKTAETKKASMQSQIPPAPLSPTSPEVLAGSADSMYSSSSVSPELLPNSSRKGSGIVSPSFSPRTQVPSSNYPTIEFVPTILPSPALAPTRSPVHSSQHGWPVPSSPALQPRQSIGSGYSVETDVDHEASAALLMLNRDRRGTIDSINGLTGTNTPDAQRRISMSVRDLLNS